MLRTDAPSVDDKVLFDSLSLASGDPLLVAMRPTVFADYDSYAHRVKNVQSAPVSALRNIDSPSAEALRNNYKVLRQVSFQYDRTAVLGSAAGKCAFCGTRDAGQMDHYLPQKTFPELAAMVGNLVPACEPCNKKKSKRYTRRVGSGRPYVHPYLHTLPAERFLSCLLTVDPGVGIAFSFSVFQSPSMDQVTFEVLQAHFELLDLNSVFQIEALGYATESLTDWYAIHRDAGTHVCVAR